jgi:glycosidase
VDVQLASRWIFPYSCCVTKLPHPIRARQALHWPLILWLALFAITQFLSAAKLRAQSPQSSSPDAPAVTKIEPPSWWTNLTPEVMLLVSGRHLEATSVTCNLASVEVSRTQSSAGGDYLFVWLKIGADTKSGTAVCRVTSPNGKTTFELPLAARTSSLGKFQGLSTEDSIYLVMPDRFANGDPTNDEPSDAPKTLNRSNPRAYHGGDLRGIRDHLPYLKDLGVSTLWLTPIVKNGAAQDYHGYGATDLYAVEPHLGTVKDYQELVAAAHQHQMKIFFDIVPNHVGPRHPWVSNPPLPDWFHGSLQHHLDSHSPVKNDFYGKPNTPAALNDPFESLVDPHAPAQIKRNLTDGWFFGTLPDMNTENPLVAQYLLQNAIWWTETSGLDGLRVDTFPYVPRKFWSTWTSGLRRIYPHLSTIGEVFHPDPTVTSFFVGGQRRYDGVDTGLTTVFDYPLYFALRDVLLNGAPVGRITDILRHDSLYVNPSMLVQFFANHDVPRFAGAENFTPAKLKLAFGLALTLRGIPQLYYGDEIALAGGNDPDNRRDFTGGWIGDPQNAFTSAGRTSEQQQIFSTAQALLHLRSTHAALQSGLLWHLFSDDLAYVFLRETEEERIVVAFNNSNQPRDIRINFQDTPAKGAVSFPTLYGDAQASLEQNQVRITMPPQSLSIFQLN